MVLNDDDESLLLRLPDARSSLLQNQHLHCTRVFVCFRANHLTTAKQETGAMCKVGKHFAVYLFTGGGGGGWSGKLYVKSMT